MLILIWLLVITVLAFVWHNIKHSARNAALKTFPTPKTRFFFHNALELVNLDLVQLTEALERWHRELGEVFLLRAGPFDRGIVFVMDPKIAEAVSLHQPDRVRSKVYKPLSRWIGKNGYLLGGEKEMKSRFKFVFKFFSPTVFEKQHIMVMNTITDGFITKLNECNNTKQTHDIFFLAKCYALDMTFKSIFDIDLDTKNGKNLDYLKAMQRFSHFAMKESMSASGDFDFINQFTNTYKEQMKALKVMQDFSMKIVKDGRKTVAEGKVPEGFFILYSFLTTMFNGKYLTDEEVRYEVDSSIFGAHETTKTSFAFAMYYLAKHPEMQQKVYEEANEFFKDDPQKLIGFKDVDSFPYIEAVIKETLRISAPIPMIGRKLKKEITVNGYVFPKNVEFVFSPYLSGRSSNHFTDPLEFNPDRFLNIEKNPFGYNPFSIGARKCIGGRYGMAVLKIAVAKFINSYQVSLTENLEDLKFYFEVVVVPNKTVNLDFVKRTEQF